MSWRGRGWHACAIAVAILATGCQAVAGLGDFTPDDNGGQGGDGQGGGGQGGSTTSAQGGASSTGGGTSTGGSTGAGIGCGPDHLVLSEVRTRGPDDGNQDFIEVLNPTNTTIVLDARFRIESRGESANSYTARWTGAEAPLTVAPGARLLLANASEPNPLDGALPDALYGSGIPDGASVVLYEGDAVLDAMCFRCDAGGLGDGFICEGDALARPAGCGTDGARSVHRRVAAGVEGCADTDDNAADLEDRGPPTPGQ